MIDTRKVYKVTFHCPTVEGEMGVVVVYLIIFSEVHFWTLVAVHPCSTCTWRYGRGLTVGLALPVKQPYLYRCEMANFLYRRDQSVGL